MHNLFDIEKTPQQVKSTVEATLTPKPASESLKFTNMSGKAVGALKRVQLVVRSKKFDMVSYMMKRFNAMRMEFEQTKKQAVSSVDSSDAVAPQLKEPVQEESEMFEVSSDEMPEDISANESVAGRAKYVTASSNKSKRRKTYSPEKILAARLNKVNAHEERMRLQD